MGRRRLVDRRGATRTELSFAAWDINIGMFFSNVVMYSIILCAAATLHHAGQTNITSAAQAASALRPLAGNAAGLLFALGMIGAGFLAIPVLTAGAAHALAETFGWRHGLSEHPRTAHQFYAVITAATLIAMAMNFYNVDPMAALFWASVIMGVLAAPLLVMIMLITNRPEVMGPRVNGVGLNLLGGATTIAVAGASAALFWSWLHP
jgi:Mn2+/Fe2+ NRAMP family transporter